jgi:hypothetical protein
MQMSASGYELSEADKISPPTYHESESSSHHPTQLPSHLDHPVEINDLPEDTLPPPSGHDSNQYHQAGLIFFHKIKDVRYLLPILWLACILFAAVPLITDIHHSTVVLISVLILPAAVIAVIGTIICAALVFIKYPLFSQRFNRASPTPFKSITSHRTNKFTYIFWIIIILLTAIALVGFIIAFALESYRLADGESELEELTLPLLSFLLGIAVTLTVLVITVIAFNRSRQFNQFALYQGKDGIQSTQLQTVSEYAEKSDA